jgi:hypothetical protein
VGFAFFVAGAIFFRESLNASSLLIIDAMVDQAPPTPEIVLPSGTGTVLDSSIAAGVCVQSQDKLYGNFNLGNLPTGGAVLREWTHH